jgi:hypothetical protein
LELIERMAINTYALAHDNPIHFQS